jgi:hypothetical protein
MVQQGIPFCGGSSCVAAVGSDARGKAMVRAPLEDARREGGSSSSLDSVTWNLESGKMDAARVPRGCSIAFPYPAVFDCRTHYCGWTASRPVAGRIPLQLQQRPMIPALAPSSPHRHSNVEPDETLSCFFFNPLTKPTTQFFASPIPATSSTEPSAKPPDPPFGFTSPAIS